MTVRMVTSPANNAVGILPVFTFTHTHTHTHTILTALLVFRDVSYVKFL